MNKSYYKEQFTIQEVIEGLRDAQGSEELNSDKQPRFSFEEFIFLLNLIFRKEKNIILISALDNISESRLCGFGFSNTASLRRVLFFQHYLNNKGNATKAAISSGYSRNSAKQQGYRILKWIQTESMERRIL